MKLRKLFNVFLGASPGASAPASPLDWIDTFIQKVRPYIFVRLEDNLLIKRPNSAIKLNPMGARIMVALLEGHSIHAVLDKTGREPGKLKEIQHFFQAVKHQLEGKLDEFSLSPAVEKEPFTMNFNTLPVLSEVAVTYRCNVKCRFCYAGCNCTVNPTGSSDEMTVAQIKEVLRQIYEEAKVPSVSFTGGEPTLRPELPELVQYASEMGMRVNLISNGLLMTPQLAKALADSGLDSAQISLEGVSAAVHDDVVQCQGAFQKSVAAVGHLKEAGIHTHTNTTINRLNLEECKQFPRFIKEELGNDKFSMNLIIPSGSGIVHDDLLVKYSEVGEHLQTIMTHSETQGVEFMWYSPVPMCMFNSVAHGLGNKGCSACDGLISIAPNGDVLPCSSLPDSVGNLLKEDFNTIWESPKATHYRIKGFAHDICKNCEHFDICNGACPIYWQHLGFDELMPPAALRGPKGGAPWNPHNPSGKNKRS